MSSVPCVGCFQRFVCLPKCRYPEKFGSGGSSLGTGGEGRLVRHLQYLQKVGDCFVLPHGWAEEMFGAVSSTTSPVPMGANPTAGQGKPSFGINCGAE